MFDRTNLDRLTILDLVDACANVEIARHLGGIAPVLQRLSALRDGHGGDAEAGMPAKQILDVMNGWDAFEDALTNTQGRFEEATTFLEQITVDEMTFGTWLLTMITNPRLVEKLADNPEAHTHLQNLWSSPDIQSHDNFVAFVRALIGVAAVVVVYAWADSVPIFETRAKALSLLRLWQKVDGYREVSCQLT
jgi:hypothetical protein